MIVERASVALKIDLTSRPRLPPATVCVVRVAVKRSRPEPASQQQQGHALAAARAGCAEQVAASGGPVISVA